MFKSQTKEIIEQFLLTLRKPKNLPYKIVTHRCPIKQKNCRLHHGEIIISSYDKEQKKFHLKYFGVHEKGILFQYDQPLQFVIKILLKQINTKKRLIKLSQLKKRIDYSQSMERKIQINLHFSDSEWKKILSKSSKKKVSPYDFCRKKLLT